MRPATLRPKALLPSSLLPTILLPSPPLPEAAGRPQRLSGVLPAAAGAGADSGVGLKALVAAAVAGVAIALLAPAANAAAPEPITGRWLTESGNLEVDIAPCGDALCGTVTKVLGNRPMPGTGNEMQVAGKPASPGLRILSGLAPSPAGDFDGRIYDRANDRTVGVRLARDGDDGLLVRPYLNPEQFGKTQRWQRLAVGRAQ